MKNVRSLLLMTVALSLPTAMLAAIPNHHGGGGGSQTTLSGAYAITFNVNIASTLPAGTTLLCKVEIAPVQGSGQGFGEGDTVKEGSSSEANAAPVETAASLAVVSGSTATCTVVIPFSWMLSSNQSQAFLSYEIEGVNAAGVLPAIVRVSAQSNVPEPLPASGTTSALTFTPTF